MTIPRRQQIRPAGYLLRHWRGELPLEQALWVNGIALTFVILGLSGLSVFGRSLTAIDTQPGLLRLVGVSMLTLVALPAWQLRGLWRTAERHLEQRTGTKLAGRGAQVAAALLSVFAVMRIAGAAGDMLIMSPQMLNSGLYRTELTVMRGGRELQIRGGFGFGLADRVAGVLENNPSIRRIRLESWGGSMTEAMQLAAIIDRHDLNTYSGVFCSNTCVVPFIAGSHRTLRGLRRIGFTHAYGLPITAAVLMRQHRVKTSFIVNWNMSGPRTWYPTREQLRMGGVVDAMLFAPGARSGKPYPRRNRPGRTGN